MPLKLSRLASFVFLCTAFLSGCTAATVEPGSADHAAIIQQDRDALQESYQGESPQYKGEKPQATTLKLSIDEALEIAVRENLDARVSALEHLSSKKEITLENIKALPSMKYTLTRNGRNNLSASSSLSLATGQQSLEPSVSQEKYRSTRDITFNWNIIDSASALMEAKNAKSRASISEERYKKVIQIGRAHV